VEEMMEKTKEWLIDKGQEIAGRIAGDRRNTIFYTSVALLCGMIIAMFVIDKEEVEDLAFPDGGGSMMGATVEGKLLPENMLQPVPTGVNIVIIGDSISRYGYLSLVYFLRWGRWFEPTLEKSNLVNERSFESLFHDNAFGEFYFQTSRMLQPYELCDCYKDEDAEAEKATEKHIENRYYHDPELKNTVTFLHAYGHQNAIHGRIKASEAYNISKWDWHKEEKHLVRHEFSDPEWEYDSWAEMIEEYLVQLDRKPDYVIVNAGQWSNNFGPDGEEVSRAFADSLKHLGSTKSMWKTTTYAKGGALMRDENPETDEYMCKLLPNCFDVSWTKEVMDHLYWDERHFFEPVYRAMNEEMLQMMGYLPKGYKKLSKYHLLKGYSTESKNEYPSANGDTKGEDDED
jgi:hypothetical protein